MSSSVFLSYRRGDSPDSVARIHGKLVARLRNREVFYDHESIELGDEFPDLLRQKVTAAGVVIVVIGPKWVEELHKRKSAPVDFVRVEISLALASGADVIPVLVGNATMPADADLADFPDLAPLLHKNAKPVPPDPLFDSECDKLIAHLERTGPADVVGSILAGKYKVQRQIGEGGMGLVYLAEQTHPVKRPVAVKVIKPGMDTKEVLARFDAERQALAVMDHPNVCKVFDAGTAPNGRPFFVMEHVKGVPITKFCDDRRLTPRERLDLFMSVCKGVQHAHQKGIIHRDIKPANVLVELIDGKPVPKIIDFGLVKAMGLKLTDKSFAATEFGKWVGTLEYSSPEQAEGRFDIDALSDVYSLGVLLYELLAGSPPFTRAELMKASEDEMRRVIKEEPPTLPSKKLSSSQNLPAIAASRQLEPGALAKTIRGDLDWIILKALDKAPERRYATPTALADDVHRHLTEQPISAGKPSVAHRLGKFVRRNKGPVLAGVLVFAALVLGVVGTTLGLYAAKEAEGRAELAAEREKERADEASKEKKRADKQTDIAKTAAAQEKLRADDARREKDRADTLLTRAEKMLYANSIQAALRYWEEGKIALAIESLDSCRWDFRGWEHDYLHTKFNQGFVNLRGHTGTVYSVGFSPDGGRIVSGSSDKTLRVWDANTGKQLRALEGHTGAVTSVGFSPDGGRIVSGSADKTLRVWDAANGNDLLALIGHEDAVSGVGFSPDGGRIVSGGLDKTVRAWAVTADREHLTLEHLPGVSKFVCISPDGRRIVADDRDMVLVWDATTGKQLLTLKGHSGDVLSVGFSPDSSRIASGSEDGTMKVWDATSGKVMLAVTVCKESEKAGEGVNSVGFSSDGSRIVSGSWEGPPKVWDAITGKQLLTLRGHEDCARSVGFSPDGGRIVSGGDDRKVRVWDAASGKTLRALEGHTGAVYSVGFSPDGGRIVSGSADKTLRVWDANTGKQLRALEGHTGAVTSVGFSPDGGRIVSGGTEKLLTDIADGFGIRRVTNILPNNSARIFDTATGTNLLTLHWHNTGVSSVSFSLNNRRVAMGSTGSDVKIFDALISKERRTIYGHAYEATCVGFSNDGRYIVTGSLDQYLRVWDVSSGTELFALPHMGGVSCIRFSPDGKRIVSGSSDRTVRVWNTSDGKELLRIETHLEGVSSVDISPEGRRIVSGSFDNELKVWDSSTGKELLVLKGDQRGVRDVVFSPNGRRIASGGWDNTVRVWDANSGKELLTLKGAREEITRVAFSPDGTLVFGKDDRGLIQVWDSTTGQIQPDVIKPVPEKLPTTSPDGKLRVGIDGDGKPYLERLDNRGPDGLSPQQRWDRERLAKWAAWNPDWHTQQADESEKAAQWFAAAFHLRLLVKHAPDDRKLAARLKAAEAKLKAVAAPAPIPRKGE